MGFKMLFFNGIMILCEKMMLFLEGIWGGMLDLMEHGWRTLADLCTWDYSVVSPNTLSLAFSCIS